MKKYGILQSHILSMRMLLAMLALSVLLIPSVFAAELSITVSGVGYVSSSYPYWITCDGSCKNDIADGSEITLKVTSNSEFLGWGGACSGTQSSCIITMDSAKSVTATFEGKIVKEYLLTAYRSGTGKGTVVSNPSGLYIGNTLTYDSTKFPEGTAVTLTATASSGSKFTSWSGGCSSQSNTCTITMGADTQATAEFSSTEALKYALSVRKSGTGTGKVISDKAISCGDTCSEYVNDKESVTLTAIPDARSRFEGFSWPCSQSSTCNVVVNKDIPLSAVFSLIEEQDGQDTSNRPQQNKSTAQCGNLNQVVCDSLVCANDASCYNGCKSPYIKSSVKSSEKCIECAQGTRYIQGKCFPLDDEGYVTLQVQKKGPGMITAPFFKIYCGQYCSARYLAGSMVELSAVPDESGARFSGWQGACNGMVCTLKMDGNKNVTALFLGPPSNYLLRINVSGNGVVSSISDKNISCGTRCSASYMEQSVVELSAVPSLDQIFKGWQGECTANGSSCLVIMDATKTINALFADSGRRMLNLSIVGNGSVYFPGGPQGARMSAAVAEELLKTNKFMRLWCAQNCSSSWAVADVLRLVPEAALGYVFQGWSYSSLGPSTFATFNPCSEQQGNHCVLSMLHQRQVTATFIPVYPVSVIVQGNGMITSKDGKINCSTISESVNAHGEKGNDANVLVASLFSGVFQQEFNKNITRSCTVGYSSGSTIDLVAVAGYESEFMGWQGNCSASPSSNSFSNPSSKQSFNLSSCKSAIDAPRSISAKFITPQRYFVNLSIKTEDGVKGVVSSLDGRLSCANDCIVSVVNGTSVTLTAVPEKFRLFRGWEGACSGTSATCTFTMDSNKHVTALFSRYYILTIKKSGVAPAHILSSDLNLNDCGQDSSKSLCTQKFQQGEKVKLSILLEKSRYIYNISGACKPDQFGTCSIIMDSDKSVDALLTSVIPGKYIVKVKKIGSGNIISADSKIDCGSTKCDAKYTTIERVKLKAVPDPGWIFTGWEGDCASTTKLYGPLIKECTISLYKDNSIVDVTARFEKRLTLTLIKSGSGLGTVTSSPEGINCDKWCVFNTHDFTASLILTAKPEPGNVFGGWDAPCEERNKYTWGAYIGLQCTLDNLVDTRVAASFTQCNSDSDCQWNQGCYYNECQNIPCECGEIQDHTCTPYECCRDVSCGMYRKCNADAHKCVSVNRCYGYLNNGFTTDKIDIVILGDGYSDTQELEKDIIKVVESRDVSGNDFDGLFDISPFKENKNKFNVWMRNVPDLKHKTDDGDFKGAPDSDDTLTWANTCARDFVVVFSKQKYRPYALQPSTPKWGGTLYLSLSYYGDDTVNGRTLAHELGHAMASLGDEYTEEGKGSYDAPNCAQNIATAMIKWNDLAGKNGVGYYTSSNDIFTKLVTSPISDGGCSYVTSNIRPTKNSLMRDNINTGSFGPVNERELNKVLERYK